MSVLLPVLLTLRHISARTGYGVIFVSKVMQTITHMHAHIFSHRVKQRQVRARTFTLGAENKADPDPLMIGHFPAHVGAFSVFCYKVSLDLVPGGLSACCPCSVSELHKQYIQHKKLNYWVGVT